METALDSVGASSTKMKAIKTASGDGVEVLAKIQSNNIVGLFNSPRGFKHDAINSDNGLALLASLTLRSALNIHNNNHSKSPQKNGFKSTTTNGFIFSNTALVAKTTAAEKPKTNEGDGGDTKTNIASSNAFKSATSSITPSKATNTNIQLKNINNTIATTGTPPSPTIPSSTTSLTTTIQTTTTTTTTTIAATTATAATTPITTTTTTTTATTTSSLTIINNISNGHKNNFQIPSDILDDLASRFIINVPDMELSNLIRICFQIELAHWFYLDFFCASGEEEKEKDKKKKKKLLACGIKQFAMQIFQHIPFLRKHLSSIDKILEDWKNYKLAVPTYGAILISEDLNFCLLVQSYFAKCSWGFPKGKVNEYEDPVRCAKREVYEETGYDITGLIVPNDYIEAVINYQYTRLYIVRNVSLQTQFSPRTRNEIKCCDWFPIDSLPISKNDAISKAKLGINANSFFMIMPFVKRLKKWVNDRRTGVETTKRKFSGGNQTQAEAITSTSPKSSSPTQITNAGNCNNITNQKTTNAGSNSSIKKTKQQQQQLHNNSSDDKNALTNVTTNDTSTNKISTIATSSSTYNGQVDLSSGMTNRSKRQRHKSMGDLDGIKVNSLNNNNNNTQVNCKPIISNETTTSASIASNALNGSSNNKRSMTKNVVANGNSNSHAIITTSKRQLFHSQSQSGGSVQQQQPEKPVSSFELIRKEKQQMKATAALAEKTAKAQKQQQQPLTNGRVRVKSQSDKFGIQQNQQQYNKHQSNNHNNSNIKQRSLIITNSNVLAANNNNQQQQQSSALTLPAGGTSTLPPISGADLLNLATEAAAHNVVQSDQNTNNASHHSIVTPTLNFASTTLKTKPLKAAEQTVAIKEERSETNIPVRIVKPTNSYSSPQQQSEHQQLPSMKFAPNFNSWTNFSFTKNFITNVFC